MNVVHTVTQDLMVDPNKVKGTRPVTIQSIREFLDSAEKAGAGPNTVVGVNSGYDQKDRDSWCKLTVTWTTDV